MTGSLTQAHERHDMKVSEAFPSKYLSASDIPAENITLRMSNVETTEMEGKTKLVLSFERAKKSMILNKTNASNIAAAYGDDTDEWIGQEVVLFTTWVDYQGKSVEAVRVRAPQPKDKQRGPAPSQQARATVTKDDPRTAAAMDDEIPF